MAVLTASLRLLPWDFSGLLAEFCPYAGRLQPNAGSKFVIMPAGKVINDIKIELSQTKQRVKIEAQMKVEGVFVGGNDEASRKEGISGSAEPLQRQERARWLLRQTLSQLR